jgi:hypothetical protein
MRPYINNLPKRSIVKSLVANIGEENLSLFTVTGSVDCILWGVVTTVLADTGAGLTLAFFNLWDGSSEVEITDNAGATITNLPAGSIIAKTDVATAVATLIDSTNGAITEDATYLDFRKLFNITAKVGATTTVRFSYTAAGQASGAIQFFIEYLPRSQGASVI